MDDLLAQAAEELLSRHCTPAMVRAIRGGGDAGPLWAEIEASGFLDALVPEAAGGAGLAHAEALPLLLACGRFALPLPFGETMLARAALGTAAPAGAIALAQPVAGTDGIFGRVTPGGHAGWVVLPGAEATLLLPMAAAETVAAGSAPLSTLLRWPDAGSAARLPAADWLAAGAWLAAADMAGAMEAILDRSIRYAGERRQFGRAIAAFQAVQQQLSVLTEDVFAARIAAQLSALPGGDGIAGLDTARIAVAKARIGEAGQRVAAIAHAVHGAMGITEEVDLHLFVERLHRGRARFGSEAYWTAWLGRAFLAAPAQTSLDFVQARLGPVEGRCADE